MTAVLMLARAELRHRRGSLVVLMLLVALVSGVVLASAAGARRTSTALDRYLAATDAPDAAIGIFGDPGLASDLGRVSQLADELAELPGVTRVTPEIGYIADVGSEFDFMLLGRVPGASSEVGRPLVVAGRMPNPEATDEVALNDIAAADLGLGVGDMLHAPTISVDTFAALMAGEGEFRADGPAFDLSVVGIVRDTNSLSPEGTKNSPVGYVSPAFAASAGSAAAGVAMWSLDVDKATFDFGQALAVGGVAAADNEMFGSWMAEEMADIGTAFRSVAVGLLLFAAAAAVGGMLALGQAISRQLGLTSGVGMNASALGFTHAQRVAAVSLPITGAVVLGVCGGVLAAIGASPMFPISVARRAEPVRGVRVDWATLGVGGLVFTLVLLAWVFVVAWRQRDDRPAVARGPNGMAAWVHRTLPPAAAVGSASVVAPARRAVRAGTAILGSVVAVSAVMAIAVFTSSHHAALSTPANYGWTWTSTPDIFSDDPQSALAELTTAEGVDSVAALFCGGIPIGDSLHPACALQVTGGSLALRFTEGRAPSSPDEVALGATTMRQLDTAVGDEVSLTTFDGSEEPFRVVGQVVMPPIDNDSPGLGMAVTGEGLMTLSGEPQGDSQRLLLRYEDGVDRAELERTLPEQFDISFSAYSTPSPPERLVQLSRMRPTLVAVAVFLALLGAVGLLHYVSLSRRQRRGELAVLSALGFVRSQLRAVSCWQAMTVAVVGVLVGVPLGVVVGRRAWTATIDELGMIADPVVPVIFAAALVVTCTLGAATLGGLAGLRRHVDLPAATLRSE